MKDEAYDKNYEFEDWYWWFRIRNSIVYSAVLEHAGGGPMRVLDYGCGTGGMMEMMQPLGDVHGCDASPAALEFCRRRGLKNLLDTSDVMDGHGQYDLVTMLDVLEHVDDPAGLLSGIREMLAPGGCIVITVPALMCMWSGEDYVSEHRTRYVKKRLAAVVESAGLCPLRVTYFNMLLLPPMFFYIKISALLDRDSLKQSNLSEIPTFLNSILEFIFGLEMHMMKLFNLPVGTSLLCVAKKR